MSLMSTASFVWLTIFSFSDVDVGRVLLSVAEPSSLSCFNTEMPATCLPRDAGCSCAPSSARPCSSSVFDGVHFNLVDVGITDVVVDVDARTLLKGVGNDANFCARIFTGKFQTAPVQRTVHVCASSANWTFWHFYDTFEIGSSRCAVIKRISAHTVGLKNHYRHTRTNCKLNRLSIEWLNEWMNEWIDG